MKRFFIFIFNFIIFVASFQLKSSINNGRVCVTSNEYFVLELKEEDKYATIRIENSPRKNLVVVCEGSSLLFTKYPLLDFSLQCHLKQLKERVDVADDVSDIVDNKQINYQISDKGIIPSSYSSSTSSASSSTIQHELFLTSELLIKKDVYDVKISAISEDIKKGEYVDWVCYDGNALCAIPRSMVHTYNILHRGIGAMILDWNGCIFIHKRASSKRLFPSMLDMLIGGVSVADESSEETLLRELKEELNLDFQDTQENENSNFISTMYSDGKNKGKKKNKDVLLQSLSTKDVAAYQKFRSSILDAIFGRETRTVTDLDDKIQHEEELLTFTSMIRSLGQIRVSTSHNHCLVKVYGVVCNEKKARSISFPDGEVEWGRWVSSGELQHMLLNQRTSFVPDGLQVWDAIPNMLER